MFPRINRSEFVFSKQYQGERSLCQSHEHFSMWWLTIIWLLKDLRASALCIRSKRS